MNGRAPKSPETGSQTRVFQKESPNFAIESREFLTSSYPIAATSRKIRKAKSPVPSRNHRSSALLREDGAFGMTFPPALLKLDPFQGLGFEVHDVGRQRSISEILGVLLSVGQGPLHELDHHLRLGLVLRSFVE